MPRAAARGLNGIVQRFGDAHVDPGILCGGFVGRELPDTFGDTGWESRAVPDLRLAIALEMSA